MVQAIRAINDKVLKDDRYVIKTLLLVLPPHSEVDSHCICVGYVHCRGGCD